MALSAGLSGLTYLGKERRRSPRLPAAYPIRLQFFDDAGVFEEWFSLTENISSDGLLCASVNALEPGTEVSVSMAIPMRLDISAPAAQLDCPAVVLRSEAADREPDEGYSRRIALHFLEKPAFSTGLTMFG
jgi:hypothetical protein